MGGEWGVGVNGWISDGRHIITRNGCSVGCGGVRGGALQHSCFLESQSTEGWLSYSVSKSGCVVVPEAKGFACEMDARTTHPPTVFDNSLL